MYQVLVYVYENYGGGADTPDRQRLGMRLSSAGFERDEIQQALHWLDGLDNVADGICLTAPNDAAAPLDTGSPIWPAARDSLRVYSPQEIEHLGPQGIACFRFLEDAGARSAEVRDVVIAPALAPAEAPLDLKIIIMMVYWRMGANPDLLVLDELSDDTRHRLAH